MSERQVGCSAAGQGQPITVLFATQRWAPKRTVYGEGHNTENRAVMSKVTISFYFSLFFFFDGKF